MKSRSAATLFAAGTGVTAVNVGCSASIVGGGAVAGTDGADVWADPGPDTPAAELSGPVCEAAPPLLAWLASAVAGARRTDDTEVA